MTRVARSVTGRVEVVSTPCYFHRHAVAGPDSTQPSSPHDIILAPGPHTRAYLEWKPEGIFFASCGDKIFSTARRSTLDIRGKSRWKLTVINELSQLVIRGTVVAIVKQHARLSRLCLKRADIDADGGIWTILSVRANKWILGDFAKEQR